MNNMDVDGLASNRCCKTGRAIKHKSIRNVVVPKFSYLPLWVYDVYEIGHCKEDCFVALIVGYVAFKGCYVFIDILMKNILCSSWIARTC